MTKKRLSRKKILLLSSCLVFLGLVGVGLGVFVTLSRHADAPKAAAQASKPKPVATTPTTSTVPAFNKSMYSTTDASSLWVVVNKQHPLSPIDYAPSNLVNLYGHQVSSLMSTDLQNLMAAATKAGVSLTLASSYRSYSYQVNLYNRYVATDSQAGADTYSARPGFSEHQTGLAIDFGDKAGTCIVVDCYGSTPEGQWLAANAWQYGYILRYTPAVQSITGYESEPWHYRYVGQDLSREMHKQNIPTLEQFFGINGGETYVNTPATADTGGSQE